MSALGCYHVLEAKLLTLGRLSGKNRGNTGFSKSAGVVHAHVTGGYPPRTRDSVIDAFVYPRSGSLACYSIPLFAAILFAYLSFLTKAH